MRWGMLPAHEVTLIPFDLFGIGTDIALDPCGVEPPIPIPSHRPRAWQWGGRAMQMRRKNGAIGAAFHMQCSILPPLLRGLWQALRQRLATETGPQGICPFAERIHPKLGLFPSAAQFSRAISAMSSPILIFIQTGAEYADSHCTNLPPRIN